MCKIYLKVIETKCDFGLIFKINKKLLGIWLCAHVHMCSGILFLSEYTFAIV